MNDDEFDIHEKERNAQEAHGGFVTAAARARREKIVSFGAELLDLTKKAGSEDVRAALIERMHPYLLEVTLERMEAEGWPLPELYIVACATESACVDALAAAPDAEKKDYYEYYVDAVDEWARRCIRQERFVDHYLMRERGLDSRVHALTASLVEQTLKLPRDDRRIIYAKIKDGLPDDEIVVKFETPKRRVFRLLQNVAEAAVANIEKWTRRIERETLQHGDGDGPV